MRSEGLEGFVEQQRKRIGLLKMMLQEFDDGRSKGFYCLATALLPIAALGESLRRAEQQVKKDKAKSGDIKTRAAILRGFLDDSAAKAGVELKLRQKRK
jgi:hypothetical protein